MAKAPRRGSHSQCAKDPDTLADMKNIMDKLNTQEEMIKKLGRQLDQLAVPHAPSPKAENCTSATKMVKMGEGQAQRIFTGLGFGNDRTDEISVQSTLYFELGNDRKSAIVRPEK
ncbi:MAG: hypothetical protein Q9205_000721 [Flavoplaca limonia]